MTIKLKRLYFVNDEVEKLLNVGDIIAITIDLEFNSVTISGTRGRRVEMCSKLYVNTEYNYVGFAFTEKFEICINRDGAIYQVCR